MHRDDGLYTAKAGNGVAQFSVEAHIELRAEAVAVVRAKAPGGFNVEVRLEAVHIGTDAVPCATPRMLH